MANIALILAGGSGARMHQNIPKQFLTINDRPVIVYMLDWKSALDDLGIGEIFKSD